MNIDELVAAGCDVREDCPMSGFTTLRIGGPARRVISCSTPEHLREAVIQSSVEPIPPVLIGGGSNLLVSDEGIPLTVLRYYSEAPQIEKRGLFLDVSGATLLDDVSRYAAEEGLDGLSFAAGIPGTVGGAVAGNAGAFGEQLGDRVDTVHLMDRAGVIRREPAAALGFRYRGSRLQASGDIVVSVRLRVTAGDRGGLRARREEILSLRAAKHPDWRVLSTAGSFFKNIEPTSKAERRQAAGYYLEQAGAKDLRVGRAYVYEKHANIIIAGEGSSAADVLELSRRMADAVRQKFGIPLVREVRLLGRFPEGDGQTSC